MHFRSGLPTRTWCFTTTRHAPLKSINTQCIFKVICPHVHDVLLTSFFTRPRYCFKNLRSGTVHFQSCLPTHTWCFTTTRHAPLKSQIAQCIFKVICPHANDVLLTSFFTRPRYCFKNLRSGTVHFQSCLPTHTWCFTTTRHAPLKSKIAHQRY